MTLKSKRDRILLNALMRVLAAIAILWFWIVAPESHRAQASLEPPASCELSSEQCYDD